MKNDDVSNQTSNTTETASSTKSNGQAVDTVNILMVSKRPHILAHRQARWARRQAHA